MSIPVSRFPIPVLREIVDGALLVRFPEVSDEEANRAAVAIADGLVRAPGVDEAIPAARSLLVLFDPAVVPLERVTRSIEDSLGADRGRAEVASRLLRIPVHYGGEAGSDLPEIARRAGLDPEEFARRHAAAEYRVAFLGFAPGFAYLRGLPAELAAPRLETPRTRVPAGSVAIGGEYTGIYPSETPGGWRLIGRAAVRLYELAPEPRALFAAGDHVRFEPIGERELERRLDALARTAAPIGAVARADSERALFRVVSAGVWTSVQGAPRYGWARAGVPAGGAMDAASLAAGNALVQNAPGFAALELNFVGPELEVLDAASAVLSGAQVETAVNGRALDGAAPFSLAVGDRVRIGRLEGGSRAYLCVRGGLVGSPAGTFRRLEPRDEVFAAGIPPATSTAPALPAEQSRPRGMVRVVLGPDEDRFTEEGIATFLEAPYRVSIASDRRGIRLEGPAVRHREAPDVPPEGTPLGGVQVARDGQPIVLGPDRPVTGGYARIATVIGADFPLVAQAAPGETLRFRAVGVREALEARGWMNNPV